MPITQLDRDRLEDLGLDAYGDHTEDLRATNENGPGLRQQSEANVLHPTAK